MEVMSMSTYFDPSAGIPYGLDADKPANPAVGLIYVSTDTSTMYMSFETGHWTEISVSLLFQTMSMSYVDLTNGYVRTLLDPTAGTDVYFDSGDTGNQSMSAGVWKTLTTWSIKNGLPAGWKASQRVVASSTGGGVGGRVLINGVVHAENAYTTADDRTFQYTMPAVSESDVITFQAINYEAISCKNAHCRIIGTVTSTKINSPLV
jgi:hypothetical protein